MKSISFDDLKDKNCVITGGGGVIGSAIAVGLASVGVRTAIVDINKEAADKVAASVEKETGTKSVGVSANVLEKESLKKAKSEINEKLGEIHLLINGAGGNSPKATTQKEQIEKEDMGDLSGTFYGLDLDGFKWVFDLNFMGTLLPTMVFTGDMLKNGKGAVLNVSSMNSYKPLTKIPAYSAAKASVNNFTEWLSVHLAKAGIRVNAVAPGFFLTNQNRFLLTDEKTGDLTDRGRKIIANTPTAKFGEPEDLQGTVCYLLSDIAAFVTGIVIPVDGGYSAFGGV